MKRILSIAMLMFAAPAFAQNSPPQASCDIKLQICHRVLNGENTMAIGSLGEAQATIDQLQRQIADLQKQLSDEKAKNIPKPETSR